MLKAVLRIDGPVARLTVPAMGPKAERELPRTETSLSEEDDAVTVTVTAVDASAMRAALNSHLECIKIIEDIEYLTEMKP